MVTCKVDGCGGKLKAHGYCHRHYMQLRRHGSIGSDRRWARPVVDELADCVVVEATGCREWQGRTNPFGYGVGPHDGRMQVAHRVAYEVEHGPIPEGVIIRHTCDNPPCCNPEHLIPGTHGSCVLTWELVDAIRSRRSAGESIRSIADALGLHPNTVRDAACGRTWKDSQRP